MSSQQFVPVPKTGTRLLGLSRSTIYKLISALEANGYQPLVRSVSMKTHPHNKRGKRLIDLESLKAYIASSSNGWKNAA